MSSGRSLSLSAWLIAGSLFFSVNVSNAQSVTGTSPSENDIPADSLQKWKAAVESGINNLAAHQEFIKLVGLQHPALTKQYEEWMKRFPTSEKIPFALGTALCNRESPKAKPYLLAAVKINPRLAEAWQMLAIDAERWGNEDAAREYMGKAAAAEPDNPSYSFYYAMDFEHTDPAKWRSMLYALAKRFPAHERGAQGLYWLATRSTDAAEKLRVYELLRASYSPKKFNWSASGMNPLYDIYLEKDPAKALELAKYMSDVQGWSGKDTLAEYTISVRSLLAANKASEAFKLTEKMKAPRYSGAANMIALLKAEARSAKGDTKGAYDSLVSIYAKLPADELYTGINKYAAKLGKTAKQVEADIWKVRDAAARPAPPFRLGLYTSNGTASLDDYKGKVVLLTFWFPGCGPCRGEFPHFESVLQKFRGKDVAYLGINVVPEQDEYVLPFMEGTKYSFTPLRATSEWAQQVYKVRGQPTNFLIDKNGKIVFSNFRTDANNHRELELMISSLLNRS